MLDDRKHKVYSVLTSLIEKKKDENQKQQQIMTRTKVCIKKIGAQQQKKMERVPSILAYIFQQDIYSKL